MNLPNKCNNDTAQILSSTEMKRRRGVPPPRLEWPAPSIFSYSSSSKTSSTATTNVVPSKKAKRSINHADLKQNNELSSNLMWIDKHVPLSSSNLCVAPKKIQEVKEWMSSNNDNNPKLLILTGGSGVGKTTMIRLLAEELGFTLLEWEAESSASSFLPHRHHVSQLDSFHDFLSSGGRGFQTLSIVTDKHTSSDNNNRAMLLIEELPNLYNEDAREKFRSIMYEHCQGAISTPTVLIFSSISEGASSSNTTMDLQKLLHLDDSSIMPFIKIINCNGVTKAKMKACLTNIAQKERRTINDALFESIWMTASGDIRSAIHTLQFHCYSVSTTATQQQHDKDVRLTSFHALGKILYAKRQATNNNENNNDWLNHKRLSSMPARLLMDTRPPLDFDPEKVLNENDLGPEGSIFFLSFHAVDFFEEVLELCDAMETFSDAAMFLQPPVYQSGESIYPVQYLASLASRAVADANKHPAPRRFKPLSSPKVFEVMRKQTENKMKLHQLCQKLSYQGDTSSLAESCVIGSIQKVVVDSLPFIRKILQNETSYDLSNMHSIASNCTQNSFSLSSQDRNSKRRQEAVEQEAFISEQRLLLEMDDIIDDDEDDVLIQTSQSRGEATRLKPQSKREEIIIIE